MKSAYELAMERLAKESPIEDVTDEQKKAIAEIDKNIHQKSLSEKYFSKARWRMR